MGALGAAALAWLAVHLGVAGTGLRGRAVRAIGERGFRGVFSVLAVLLLAWLALAYHRAPTATVWIAPWWLVWLIDLAMLPACMLLVASFSPRNPTMAGTEAAFGGAVRGVFRITRHPMLCAYGLWAALHMLATGDAASLLFFGTLLVTVLAGMPSIDGKLARRDAQRWAGLRRETSALPFAAILAGRNRLVLAEIGWVVPAAGVALWLILMALHRPVIGVAPLPPG